MHRPTSGARALSLALALAFLTSAAPSVLASHLTVDRMVFNDGVATREDDGLTFSSTGHIFDGIVNKVTFGGTPGDGGMFLDARLSNTLAPGPAQDGFALYPGSYFAPATGRADLLMPGQYTSSAWYGQWNDLDQDGIIDDVHDALAAGDDEFAWRGLGSGETSVTIVDFVVPLSWEGGLFSYGPKIRGTYAAQYNRGSEMLDRTAHENPEQEWVSRTKWANADGGFLMSIQHLTVAGAAAAAAIEEEYDIFDPAALVDVDRYTGLGPDVESLYLAAIDITYPFQYSDAFWRIERPIEQEYVTPRRDEADALVEEVSNEAPDTAEAMAMVTTLRFTATGLGFNTLDDRSPLEPKEPNTVEDDFQGRAWFGGVGDVEGSYNSYPGFVGSWHLFFSAWPRTTLCAGVSSQGTPVAYEATPACQEIIEDPLASYLIDQRSSQMVMSFTSKTFLWNDLNGDSAPGAGCDPTKPDGGYDAERNTCDRYAVSRSQQYTTTASWESHGSCETAKAKAGTFTVQPMGADWVGAVLVRDHHFPTKSATGTAPVVLEGREPVTLRWKDNCENDGYFMKSRDAIVFVTGETTYPLRVESRQGMDAFRDVENGIDNYDEYVVDVDYIPPVF